MWYRSLSLFYVVIFNVIDLKHLVIEEKMELVLQYRWLIIL